MEETRYYLNDKFIFISRTTNLTAVATDGHRLAALSQKVTSGSGVHDNNTA